jgi:hypothetical protein
MNDDSFWAEAAHDRHRAFGRDAGLTDQALARERRAQAIFFPALARFRGALGEATALTHLMAEDLRYLADALDDHAPGETFWNEKIAESRP